MNMLSTISCLVLSLSLVAAVCKGEGYQYPTPPTCARFECTNYTVIHSQKEFEIRDYNQTKYVFTPEILANSYKEGASKGFKILLDYIKGDNEEAHHLNMTSPVLVRVENSTYTTYFFLPQMFQKLIPTPKNREINWWHLPYLGHKYVAVRRFGGVIDDGSIATNLAALKKSVESTPYEIAAKSNDSMVAAYNSPRELTDRVNEIFLWFY